jgi:hypothetical protein
VLPKNTCSHIFGSSHCNDIDLSIQSLAFELLQIILADYRSMADPLSISASIAALLQVSGTVLQYIKSSKDANKDMKAFQVEMINVRGLLLSLKELLPDPESGESSLLPVFESLGGALKQFETILTELVSKLQPKGGFGKAGKVMSWHFKKDEVKNLISVVERYKTLFSLALQSDQM